MHKIVRCGLLIILSHFAMAQPINIAVASNFAPVARALAQKFQQQSGDKVLILSGSTAMLANQIRNGAPYAVFLAADTDTPCELIAHGFAVPESQFTYAYGQLVLWSADPDLVDHAGAVLFSNTFARLAMANPKLAPYGRSAQVVLTKLGLINKLQNKIIYAENISTTYQYVASGNVALGFIALSQIYKDGGISHGSVWVIPKSLIPLIKQDGVLTKFGEKNLVAQKFINFMHSATARLIIKNAGYM